MKNLVFAIILPGTFFFSGSALGQAFDGGILGGMSVNQIDGDTYGGYNKAGIVAGAWIRTNPDHRSQLQLELRYYTKGARPRLSPDNQSFPKTNLQYVDMPVLLNLRLTKKISAQLGAAGGYLLKAEEDITGNGYLPVTIPFRSVELSGQLGAEYQLFEHLQFAVRCSYSLLPVRLNPGHPVRYLDRGQYNNSLAFALYYTLNRRK
jgi:hypothetical protein